MCDEHDRLDSAEYVDIVCDNTLERALDPAGGKAARLTELEFIDSAGVWQVVLRLSSDFGVPMVKGWWPYSLRRNRNPSWAQGVVGGRALRGNATAELFKVSVGIWRAQTDSLMRRVRGPSHQEPNVSCSLTWKEHTA